MWAVASTRPICLLVTSAGPKRTNASCAKPAKRASAKGNLVNTFTNHLTFNDRVSFFIKGTKTKLLITLFLHFHNYPETLFLKVAFVVFFLIFCYRLRLLKLKLIHCRTF